jgi:hypothetical protein
MKIIPLPCLLLSLFAGSVYSQTDLTLIIHQPEELRINAGSDTTITSGDTLTLGGSPTATGGLGYYDYTWQPITFLNNPYTSNPIASNVSEPVTYILTVEDENCHKQDTVNIKLSGHNSIDEQSNSAYIRIYPVPAVDILTIECNYTGSNKLFVEVSSQEGKCIYYSQMDNSLTTLNLESFSPGIYTVRIKSAEFEKSFPVIKE